MTAPRPSEELHVSEQRRTWWGRAWRYVLAPPFYWFDILDNQRRPSHSKLMWSVAFGVAIVVGLYATVMVFGDRDTPTATELAFVLGYWTLTFALAGGLDGFKTWVKSSGGGTVSAFTSALNAATPDGREHPSGD